MLHLRKGKEGLFCFFEGERGADNAYYGPRIKTIFQEYHSFNCGGRDRVLEVFNMITSHQEYDKYKKAYFIDRDFNRGIYIDENIYETPCYSIENLYVSTETFKEILKHVLQIAETDQDFEVCVNLFHARQNEYHYATELLNAWYSCLIEIRNNFGTRTGVRLGASPPNELVNVTLESVTSNYDIQTLTQMFPQSPPIDPEILSARIIEFRECNQSLAFRGKYELSFVLTFLDLLITNSKSSETILQNKLKFIFGSHLNIDQAISLFSSFADTPPCLTTYLQSINN